MEVDLNQQSAGNTPGIKKIPKGTIPQGDYSYVCESCGKDSNTFEQAYENNMVRDGKVLKRSLYPASKCCQSLVEMWDQGSDKCLGTLQFEDAMETLEDEPTSESIATNEAEDAPGSDAKHSDNEIKSVLSAMFNSFASSKSDQEDEIFAIIQDSSFVAENKAHLEKMDPELFDLFWIDKMNGVTSSMVRSVWPQLQDSFIFEQAGYVENQFNSMFEMFEGSFYCADKSRTAVKVLARHLCTGQDFEFDYGQEYTYHLPKVIMKTQKDIIAFYQAIKALYYGSPGPYMNCMLEFQNARKAFDDAREESDAEKP